VSTSGVPTHRPCYPARTASVESSFLGVCTRGRHELSAMSGCLSDSDFEQAPKRAGRSRDAFEAVTQFHTQCIDGL